MPRRRLKVESQYEIDLQSRSRRFIGTSLRDRDDLEIEKMQRLRKTFADYHKKLKRDLREIKRDAVLSQNL